MNTFKFGNKIEAIKALRSYPGVLELVEAQTVDFGSKQSMVRVVPLSLKDAKDFVEAVMELGANEVKKELFIYDSLRNEVRVGDRITVIKWISCDDNSYLGYKLKVVAIQDANNLVVDASEGSQCNDYLRNVPLSLDKVQIVKLNYFRSY